MKPVDQRSTKTAGKAGRKRFTGRHFRAAALGGQGRTGPRATSGICRRHSSRAPGRQSRTGRVAAGARAFANSSRAVYRLLNASAGAAHADHPQRRRPDLQPDGARLSRRRHPAAVGCGRGRARPLRLRHRRAGPALPHARDRFLRRRQSALSVGRLFRRRRDRLDDRHAGGAQADQGEPPGRRHRRRLLGLRQHGLRRAPGPAAGLWRRRARAAPDHHLDPSADDDDRLDAAHRAGGGARHQGERGGGSAACRRRRLR